MMVKGYYKKMKGRKTKKYIKGYKKKGKRK